VAPRVSVIIPTYNERENIRVLIPRLVRVLEDAGLDYEIIVVDDDSPDGTCDEVERISQELRGGDRIRCIRRRGERGLASAVVEGFRRARGEIAVVMDADLQHPPELVPRLVEAVEAGADIAVASRYMEGGGVEGWSRVRLLLSKLATRISWFLVPETKSTSDPMSGFFAVRLSKIDLSKLEPRGFKILVEILARSRHQCLKVVDVPYVFKKRHSGESKLGMRVALDFLLHAWKISPMPRFALVGLMGALVNLAVMAVVLWETGNVDVASVLGIEASIVFNFLLHETFTFNTWFKRSCGRTALRRLLEYHKASFAGIATTYATMKVLTVLAGLNPITAQALGIIAGFAVNYALSVGGVWSCERGCEREGAREAGGRDKGVQKVPPARHTP